MQKASRQYMMKPEKTWVVYLSVVGLFGGASLVFFYLHTANDLFFCGGAGNAGAAAMPIQVRAILHYATTKTTPQQSRKEISVSTEVLQSLGGSANFLVFGLGHDSMMWAGINAQGKTLFLEEDPKWVNTVQKETPELRVNTVQYRTQLSEADQLMRHFREEPDCAPQKSFLRGNHKCRLALDMLSDEVYDTEWDMIMLDAPRGYFDAAPGRMAAIYSAAVMARNRNRTGATHVFLHDVDRRVEKMYGQAFLCKKHLVKAEGRLWYFRIPPPVDLNAAFC